MLIAGVRISSLGSRGIIWMSLVLTDSWQAPMLGIGVVLSHLTSSQAQEDILKAYNNYANCYVTKLVDVDQLFKIVKAIESFWLAIVKLPQREVI